MLKLTPRTSSNIGGKISSRKLCKSITNFNQLLSKMGEMRHGLDDNQEVVTRHQEFEIQLNELLAFH